MTFQTILKMLEYCTASYKEIPERKPNERVVFIDDKISGVQCHLRYNEKVMTVAFRGSDSMRDWLTNFTFCKKEIPNWSGSANIKLHKGFLDAYASPSVKDKIHSLMCNSCDTIYITGHSLGAALAVVCAADIQHSFPEKELYVTLFGCPRVGNTKFSNLYNKRIFSTVRVENGNDIVTKVPPKIFGYRHVGAKIHVGHTRVPFLFSAKAHRPTKYYSSLYERFL